MLDLIFTKELLKDFKICYCYSIMRFEDSFTYSGYEFSNKLAKEIIDYFEDKLQTSCFATGIFVIK